MNKPETSSIEKNQDENYSLRILRSIRAIQKQNRFITTASGSTFSLAESHVLIELVENPELPFNRIAAMLGLDGSTISRTVASLCTQGICITTPLAGVGRRVRVTLTKEGQKIFDSFENSSNTLTKERYGQLTPLQLALFTQLLGGLCQGLEFPPSSPRKNEHPLRPTVRAITRGLGLLGSRVFGLPKLTSLEWHVLSELNELPRRSGGELIATLAIPPTTLSTVLSSLMARNLVSRQADPLDARKKLFSLRAAGQRYLMQIETQGAELIQRAAHYISEDELGTLATLFELIVDQNREEPHSLEPTALISELTSGDREFVRGSIITFFVQKNLQFQAPATLIGDNSICFVLYYRGELAGVLELQPLANRWLLTLCCLLSDELSRDYLDSLLIAGLLNLSEQSPGGQVLVGELVKDHPLLERLRASSGEFRLRKNILWSLQREIEGRRSVKH